jgi:uncharacterized phage-associated protein
MATAHDIAAYILQKQGEITAMKLQKLVFYSQAWSLVWDEEPLFQEEIQAWTNGPVVPELYKAHRGLFRVCEWPQGNPGCLTKAQRKTVGAVLDYYGDKTSQWLSDLTHREAPWLDARKGLDPGDPGRRVVTHAAMAEYYSNPY